MLHYHCNDSVGDILHSTHGIGGTRNITMELPVLHAHTQKTKQNIQTSLNYTKSTTPIGQLK